MKKYRWKARRGGLGRIGIDPMTARQTGCFKESGNQYCRQPILKNVFYGRKTKVSFALDVVIDVQYCIISARKLQPSHIGNIENPLHFLPEAQPRNRATSQSGAETPRRIAENLRPAEIVEGANAYTGASVVNQRGEVIQGSGRGYTMRLYYEENTRKFDPANYVGYIRDNGDFLGFSKSDIQQVVSNAATFRPVIVRMASVSDTDAIKLGQYKQSDLEALSTKTNEIKSRVNLIDNDKLARTLERTFADVSEDATLSEIVRNSSLLSDLIRLGAIRKEQLEELTTNGRVNARGVQYVSDILLNLVFKGSDVTFNNNKIAFNASSKSTSSKIVPIFIEMNHQ